MLRWSVREERRWRVLAYPALGWDSLHTGQSLPNIRRDTPNTSEQITDDLLSTECQ